MTQPALMQGQLLQVFLGDGATPTEAFTLLCIVSSKSLRREVQFDDFMEPSCVNPNNLPTKVKVPRSTSWSLSISGRMDASRIAPLEAWLTGTARNIQLRKAGLTGANGGGTWQGPVMLTSLEIASSDHGTVTFSAELDGIGAFPTFTAAA